MKECPAREASEYRTHRDAHICSTKWRDTINVCPIFQYTLKKLQFMNSQRGVNRWYLQLHANFPVCLSHVHSFATL